jgi:exonuclease-1
MGIKGLHKALSFCTVKDNLRNHRNSIVAVDTSSWMHRSVYSISEKFVEATDNGRLDEGCVRVSARYIIARCKELIERFGIRAVYLVMDGKRIPLKADETQDRDMKRQQNLGEARRLKKSGQRWKAEDKYKTCIRIKDEFTKAVINEVKIAFSEYGRVHLVNSPREADSQLTRLVLDGVADAVITEDSDVLVYSAAAHVAFPILFKLDRKTGDCDCIKMDWLLSLSSEEAEKPVTSTNTLEVIFRRLASRQAKRRGFGVRLFVQGCILAGCDYRKNIEGIGTTNAFKLVRDNAFRNDSVRFRKILESLPKKTKQNIDINEYEEILAKSEAIFFYHPVLHTDGNVKPLLKPRLSSDECGDEHHFTDHYPYMSRFQGDWSFLGSISSESNGNVAQISSESAENRQWVPVGPTKTTKESSSVPTNKRDCSQLFSLSSTQSKVIHNPYKKSKSYDNNVVFPLEEKNVNTHISAGNENVAKSQTKSHKRIGDITRFLVKPDPRYTKRSFSSTTTSTINAKGSKGSSLSGAGLSFRISSRSLVSKKSPVRSFFLPRSTKKQKSTASIKSTSFDYDPKLNTTMEETAFLYLPLNKSNSIEHKVIDDNGPESTTFNPVGDGFCNSDRTDFYDLTNSNSCDSDELDDRPTNGTRESNDETEKDRAIRTVPPEGAVTTTMKGSNNCSKNLDKPFSTDQLRETEQKEARSSKYFLKRTGSRRVTLDSFINPSCSGTSDVICETSILPKSASGDTNAVGKSTQGIVDSMVNSFFSPRKHSKDKN